MPAFTNSPATDQAEIIARSAEVSICRLAGTDDHLVTARFYRGRFVQWRLVRQSSGFPPVWTAWDASPDHDVISFAALAGAIARKHRDLPRIGSHSHT